MGEKEPFGDSGLTHGICPSCYDHFSRQWEGYQLSDFLDQFDQPILIFSGDTRVIAFNQSYAQAYLEDGEKPRGLLGGEFMECARARLPEGCGKTVHCRSCAIRNTINATFRTGQSQKDVPAYLNTDVNGKPAVKKLRLSSEIQGLMVKLMIEDMGADTAGSPTQGSSASIS